MIKLKTLTLIFLIALFVILPINFVDAQELAFFTNSKVYSDGQPLSVSGVGIPEENLQDIFEPLFTTRQTGTGLGLASCRSLVEQHGGTITAKNNPTTFTITLPKA